MYKKEYWTILAASVIAGLLGGLISGRFLVGEPVSAKETTQRAQVIEAAGFQVVDMNGKPRAHLGTRPDGSMTSLSIGYEEGEPRASLSSLPDGSIALALVGPDGRSTSLSWDVGGRMGLTLVDKNRNIRGQVFLGSDGSPFLVFQDKSGKAIHKVP